MQNTQAEALITVHQISFLLPEIVAINVNVGGL